MTTSVQPLRLGWLRLVGTQFTLILRSGRWIELIGAVVALLVLALGGAWIEMPADSVHDRLLASRMLWLALTIVLVACWPAMLWAGEPPRARRYHWSLPVSRGPHDLARVAAGGVWVLIAAALVIVLYASVFPGVDLVDLAGLAGYALGLLAIYALASIAAVATNRPARWFFGIVIAYMLLLMLITPNDYGAEHNGLRAPLVGRYGFLSAVAGFRVEEDVRTTPARDRFDSVPATPVSRGRARGNLGAPQIPDSMVSRGRPEEIEVTSIAAVPGIPNLQNAIASALWLGGAIAVLLFVSVSRHEHGPQ